MENSIKQAIKEEITNKLKKELTTILQKYEIKQQVTNKIVGEISVLSILAVDNHINLR